MNRAILLFSSYISYYLYKSILVTLKVLLKEAHPISPEKDLNYFWFFHINKSLIAISI